MTTENQARLMRRSRCPTATIAERLGITERHARRCTQGVNAPASALVGTKDEHILWRTYYRIDRSYQRVAERFGVSRQRVHAALTS